MLDCTAFEAELRHLAGGTFFGVEFVKRTNGELRKMVCRLGVSPKPPKLTIQEAQARRTRTLQQGLLTVWDAQKKAFRHVPVDAIRRLQLRGTEIIREGTIDGS